MEFVSGYLDDVGLGDTVPRLIQQVQQLERSCLAIGLRLNHSKCEVIGLSQSSEEAWNNSGLDFLSRPIEEASLLGAPLHIIMALRQHYQLSASSWKTWPSALTN